jgi:heat shock protein HslJ
MLEGQTWHLMDLRGETVLDPIEIDMTIEGDVVSGSSGCNQYNGAATYGEGEITLGPNFATTRMACDPPVMDQEQDYLLALSEATTYEISGNQLSLADATGTVVATFHP